MIGLSSVEEVCRLEPVLRIAMGIAYQDGMREDEVRDLYEQVCLGEATISEMLNEIAGNLRNEALKASLAVLRLRLSAFK